MNLVCLICNAKNIHPKNTKNIYTESTAGGETLASVLSDIIDKPIPEEGLYSNIICKKCFKNCMDFDTYQLKLQQIKSEVLDQFKNTLPKHGLKFDSFNVEVLKKRPVEQDMSSPERKSTGKKLVVPLSKLQPLPPDYVIDVGKLGLSNRFKPTLPKIMSVTSIMQPTVKASISATIQNVTSLVSTPKTTTQTIDLSKIESSAITSILTTKTTDSIISLDGNILHKSFLAASMLDENIENLKKECDQDQDGENNDEQPMEIDEDCTLVRVADDDPLNIESDKNTKDSKLFDVSLLPLTNADKLEVLEDDDDQHTIVMTGENGSILRVVSGQKLVYEDGQLALVADNDQNDHDDHDSNDESQIELQVSGDEETANAIIAAAQEQGGAFIKVESGEMFRVKSVQSKAGSSSEVSEQPGVQIVALEGGEFRCLICEKADPELQKTHTTANVGDPETMMQHLKTEHNARLYICQICKKIMRKRSDYSTHIEEHAAKCNKILLPDKSKVHECNVCKKKYSSRTLLQEHMNFHNGTRPYVCSVCKKDFASKYTHQAHMKTHLERPRPFKCKECPKSFFTQQNLTQHEKTHLGIKEFICNICGKAFGTQHNLEVHGVVHSGARPFECAFCGKGFARRAEVNDHMRIHTGERPFSCEVCGASFSQRSNLHSHRRATHYDDKRYCCTQCPKRFKRKRLLDYHTKASHTGERPLQCTVCRATFVYPEHYRKHARIHSGEKPFRCEVCGKTFNSRDNRNTHRFVHSDKKPYECLVCGAGYMRKQLLYAHMNASGHLAESIVVNQPRVQKVTEQNTDTAVVVDTSKTVTNDIFESTEPFELETSENKSEGDNAAKLFLTGDKKLVLQDGKSTINLVQEGDDSTLLTFLQNLDGGGKTDALQGILAEQLSEQVQMVATTDETGAMRLVQIQLENGSTGWMAVNPE